MASMKDRTANHEMEQYYDYGTNFNASNSSTGHELDKTSICYRDNTATDAATNTEKKTIQTKKTAQGQQTLSINVYRQHTYCKKADNVLVPSCTDHGIKQQTTF